MGVGSDAKFSKHRAWTSGAHWVALVIFIEERKMSAAQILNLKIQQTPLLFSKENVIPAMKMRKMAKFRRKEPILPPMYAFSFER